VIDAWLGCYPDVPEREDPELVRFDLTRLPTHLVVDPNHPLLRLGDAVTLEDVRHYPTLALPANAFPKIAMALQELGLWTAPSDIRRYDYSSWEGLTADQVTVAYASPFSMALYPTPKVALPIALPLEVGDTLMVRRRFANHPRCQQLVQQLQTRAAELAERFPDVSLPR
jgi:DNA-binding transcriptional LysR family regulator